MARALWFGALGVSKEGTLHPFSNFLDVGYVALRVYRQPLGKQSTTRAFNYAIKSRRSTTVLIFSLVTLGLLDSLRWLLALSRVPRWNDCCAGGRSRF